MAFEARRRRVGRLRPRQDLADGGHAPALAFGQVAGLCGKRGVLPGPGRGLFPQMALVLAAADIALPRRPRKLAFPAAHVGAVDALMPGRDLAAAARLETAMLDADGAGVALVGQGAVHGLRDKGAESLREFAAFLKVVPLARFGSKSLGRHASGRRQHVAVEIALIALPAWPVDRKIGGDAVRVGKMAGDDLRRL